MANPMLLWFVGYSNITSIAVVTVCFLAMTIFIGLISMNGDNPSRSSVHFGIEQKNMVKLSNPFFLELQQSSSKLIGGLHLRLSSLLPSKIFVLWGAKISPFHDLILQPGRWLQRTFICNNREDYENLDVLHCDQIQFFEPGSHSIRLQCPDCVSSETLGDMPRKRYPVAVLIFIPENSATATNASGQDTQDFANSENLPEGEAECERENNNYIIGLIAIVHLQDEKVTQSSHIISQYVKSAGVPLYSLQPLYLNTDATKGQKNHHNRPDEVVQHLNQHMSSRTGDSSLDSDPSGHVNHQNQFSSEEMDSSAEFSTGNCTDKACHLPGRGASNDRLGNISASNDRSENMFSVNDRSGNMCSQCLQNSVTTDSTHSVRHSEEPRQKILGRQVLLESSCDHINNREGESDFQTGSIAECVVCQTHHVRCALLPCRHACVCLGCFKLLDRCPMCRAGIESYFLLQNNLDVGEDDDTNEDDEDDIIQDIQHQAVNASFYQVLHRLNERLNHWLGFR